MMRRAKARIAAGIASLVMAAGIGLTGAQPASAAASYISVWEGSCSSGYVCLFHDYQLQYTGYGYYNDVWNMATIPSPYNGMNNDSRSARNNSNAGNATKFYDVAGGSGTSRCLRPGYVLGYLGVLDQKTSALVWSSSCGSVAYF
ncbi:hypothetical protein [Micromonospora sp. DT229]|uniref:hypothetical protein n=1 Tax=Micromonospora sp. DT229 TaxID=3393430 RepID=UPI003CEDE33D